MKTPYDVAVIGGGLAGLTMSINLAKQGFTVIVFEKENYPFHKVCGEYISFESWNYLGQLGVPLSNMKLPLINKLVVSSPSGKILKASLPLGGFGISRYKLDNELKNIAVQNGVTVKEGCKAEDIAFTDELFTVQASGGTYYSKVCCGSFGKKSNLDVKWKRSDNFFANNKKRNYVAIKYHVKSHRSPETIELHNFSDGYCGISRIEDDKYCVCYLTTALKLKTAGSVEQLEKTVLARNPHLADIFSSSDKLYATPLSISNITFDKKSQVHEHILMAGDAAGMISPLCGNGMSMAMHAGKIASFYISEFLNKKITRQQLETSYTKEWEMNFKKRLAAGRVIQSLFGKSLMTNIFISLMKGLPGITRKVISLTHGRSY